MSGVVWGCMGHYFEWMWDVWGIILDGWGGWKNILGGREWVRMNGDEWGAWG